VNDELDLLIERYLAGAATEEETRRLETLLRSDRAALRSFRLALDEDVSLRKILSFNPEREPSIRRPLTRVWRRTPPNPWTPFLAFASVVVACIVLFSLLSTPSTPHATAVRHRKIKSLEERRHAEDRLVEIERERRTLIETPQKVDEQRRRIVELEDERRTIEEELKMAVDSHPPEPPPSPPKESAPQKKAPETVVAPPVRAEIPALTLDRVEGSVFIVSDAGRVEAAAGGRVAAGQGLETAGARSLAVANFADGTRVELGGDASIRDAFEIDGRKGKRLFIARGSMSARVARQPLSAPMIVTTPQAEIRVLGTSLRVLVEAGEKGSTRLEVTEGKVQIRRTDGKSLEVSAGHFAVASGGGDFASKPLPIDEILLGPEQARLVGVEWKPVKDPATGSGLALEALETTYKIRRAGGTFVYESIRNRPNYVLFTFMADAGRDYHVWIRGRTMATTEKNLHDEVAIEPVTGQLGQKCRQLGSTGDNAFCFTGWMLHTGYAWIGGYGEDGTSDTVPLSIRFPRPGPQTLKLYVIETPMRIDGIWLSTTQITRPPADQRMPVREGK
jgi:ferric-dicitrate binding protein FerR (iron transport regulator)